MTRNAIDPEKRLFAVALAITCRIWKPFLAATLVLVSASVARGAVIDPLPLALLRTMALMIVGYAAYRTLLTGGAIAGWDAAATREGRVPWRFSGVMLMILTPMLVLGLIWSAPDAAAQAPAALHAPRGLGGVAFGMALMVGYAVAYVLLGTALPEVADRGDVRLGRAIARGAAQYRRIAISLMFGPWLFRAGVVVVIVLASFAGITVDFYDADTGAFQPEALVPMLVFMAAQVFAEVLTAVVLVRAYRRY